MSGEEGEQHQLVKKDGKTIYDAGYLTIIFKNFLAGFSRAAGAVLVYLVLLAFLYFFSITYILPELKNFIPSLIPSYEDLMPAYLNNSGTSGKGQSGSSYYVSPEQFNEAVEALQEYNSQNNKD